MINRDILKTAATLYLKAYNDYLQQIIDTNNPNNHCDRIVAAETALDDATAAITDAAAAITTKQPPPPRPQLPHINCIDPHCICCVGFGTDHIQIPLIIPLTAAITRTLADLRHVYSKGSLNNHDAGLISQVIVRLEQHLPHN